MKKRLPITIKKIDDIIFKIDSHHQITILEDTKTSYKTRIDNNKVIIIDDDIKKIINHPKKVNPSKKNLKGNNKQIKPKQMKIQRPINMKKIYKIDKKKNNTTSIQNKNIPKTSDNYHILYYFIALCISLISIYTIKKKYFN